MTPGQMVRIPAYGVVGTVDAIGRGYVDIIEDNGNVWTVPEDKVEARGEDAGE